MSGFDCRIEKGRVLEDELASFLESRGIDYKRVGYERLKDRFAPPRISERALRLVRFMPDFAVRKNGRAILFVEVKASSGIARDCYDAYTKLQALLGLPVLLFCRNRLLCRLEDLKFQVPSSFDSVAGMHVPIRDTFWRTPRDLPREQYLEYLRAYGGRTSGSGFAFFDFDNTRFFPLECLIDMMRG